MAIHHECLQATRESGDREGEVYALAEIGRVWLALGQPDQALASLGSAVDLLSALGASHPAATFLVDAGRAQHALGNQTAALAPCPCSTTPTPPGPPTSGTASTAQSAVRASVGLRPAARIDGYTPTAVRLS
jgi:hypothetical protein